MDVTFRDEFGKVNVIIGTEMMNSCYETTMEDWLDLLQEVSSVN